MSLSSRRRIQSQISSYSAFYGHENQRDRGERRNIRSVHGCCGCTPIARKIRFRFEEKSGFACSEGKRCCALRKVISDFFPFLLLRGWIWCATNLCRFKPLNLILNGVLNGVLIGVLWELNRQHQQPVGSSQRASRHARTPKAARKTRAQTAARVAPTAPQPLLHPFDAKSSAEIRVKSVHDGSHFILFQFCSYFLRFI